MLLVAVGTFGLCTPVWAQENRAQQAEKPEPPPDPRSPSEEARGSEPEPPPERASETEIPPPEPQAPAEGEVDEPVESFSPERPTDPCQVRASQDEAWLDQFRREVFETVCESAQWFDSFFGSRRFDEEARQTHGRLGLLMVWDEEDGIEFDGRLRVRVDFPNLDHRINAFLGREDEQDFLTGSEDRLDFLPTFFEREGEEEWLIGLGYRPVSSDRTSVDFDAGIEAESPIDPFVRGRYRYYRLVGNESLMRIQQTVYWTNQRDLGSGTRIDFERPVGTKSLARIAGNVVFDGETEGADWNSGITLYHSISEDRALSWFVGIDGETGREVPIEDYGTRVTYRQRMFREWFFGELVTGVTWPRDDLLDERERAWHLGLGFEISFSGEDLGLGR